MNTLFNTKKMNTILYTKQIRKKKMNILHEKNEYLILYGKNMNTL